MKIYEIGTGYTPIPAQMGAATEIVVEELTKSFIKNGHDVCIIDIKSNNRASNNLPIIEVPVPKQFCSTDVQLGIMHKLKRVIYSISLACKLKKIIQKEHDKIVIHFHNQYNMYFFLKLVPKKLRKKCILAYTNHSYIWHGKWENIKDTIKKRYFQEVKCMKKADYVYVLNETTKNTLIKELGIPKEKIIMIDNGVNTDIYSPLSDEEVLKIKDKLNLSEKKIFVQVGSICDRKNQMGAIKLLEPVLKKDKNSMFLYAGGIIDEEYQKNIIQYALKNNLNEQIRYLGEIKPGKELNELYCIADAMIFPSKSEGFSLVIIEAMSSGTPVLINNNLEFKLAEQCCRYCDSKNFIEVMEEKILEPSELKKESVKARSIVMKYYSWDKISEDYLKHWN